MRRACELSGLASDTYHLLNVPSTWMRASSLQLYMSELKRLGDFLISLGGNPVEADHLRDIMTDYQEKRDQLLACRDSVSPKAFSRAVAQFHLTGLVPELKFSARPQHKFVPIALLGGPLLSDDFNLFDIIEEAGGYVILDGTETGERTLPRPFHKKRLLEDPLLELSDAYFGSIPDAFKRPNTQLYNWIKKEIRDREIRGIVFIRNLWCDLWHGERTRLQEWLDLPLLDIDLNGEASYSRNRTRIHAFLEALQ
jgi:benzoyl-CoA reductase/2-hydroxyglutaryl-CoA dehydratase subunit BcrC/BadD/HgdB